MRPVEPGIGRIRSCRAAQACRMPTTGAIDGMDVCPCAKRTAVGWRGAAGSRSCSHGHDRHRHPRHDRRRAPGLRPDAGADGGARPADARRGAGRAGCPPSALTARRISSPPGSCGTARRWSCSRSRARPRCATCAQPAADGRGRRSRGRLLGRADRGRGDVPRRGGGDPGRVLRQVRDRARARTPRRRDLPRDLHPGHPHRPDALPPVARPRRGARPACPWRSPQRRSAVARPSARASRPPSPGPARAWRPSSSHPAR